MLWNSLQLKIHTVIDSIKHASLGRIPMAFITHFFKTLLGDKLWFLLISFLYFVACVFLVSYVWDLFTAEQLIYWKKGHFGICCNTSKIIALKQLTILGFVKIIWIKWLVWLVCGSENDSLFENNWKQQVVSRCDVYVDHDWIQPDSAWKVRLMIYESPI